MLFNTIKVKLVEGSSSFSNSDISINRNEIKETKLTLSIMKAISNKILEKVTEEKKDDNSN